ncbi:M16 family metallopeptidase [Flavobacterium pectinovorum]|uniref:M16 family metallopeptidase n=1 Tax=Flavobacterium pectinovorum TaxID=29533 RepID=UPI001FAD0FFB|nr:M16 family metallopeptidase [Flavobacterium pectinovorum]MCI9843586.1 insulinase family protein [Flavobacterium pectinovorum]
MKHILILFISFFIAVLSKTTAQNVKESDPLPPDLTIIKGVLPNGMTYYIKRTEVVRNAASYYIIQNVGSILENDDQQGLAHFLEHMAFNGTESFPGKGILNTLQKSGAVFGKDINAYTSFDETVYNMNNIPTKDGLVDVCLTVLRDWSNKLLLTDEEIDAERGVIKEEWRTRQNGQSRVMEKSLPVRFNNAKYAQRLPIGLMSVVENFKYKALRDFYRDWYRSDLQAIAVIGDIDVKVVEQQIKEKFASVKPISDPKKRFVVAIAPNDKMQYVQVSDPEISAASLNFGIRHPRVLNEQTAGDLKRSLLESMALKMLSDRISEKAQRPEASFLGARTAYSAMTRTSNSLAISVSPKPNLQQAAFKEVMTEVVRAVKFGYTDSEIDRAKQVIETSYENQIAAKNDNSHKEIEDAIQDNFLSGTAMTDVEQEYPIAKNILASLNKEELHNTIKNLYTRENRFLIVTAVEGQDSLSEETALDILAEVELGSSIVPYTEASAGKTLISGLEIKAGDIKSVKTDKKTGAVTFKLSNGVVVHYKHTDKEKNKVSLNALSNGGTSLLKDEELPSADFVTNLAEMSGLGEFNSTELKKIITGKTARISLSLGEINESIYGNSNTKDVETMLQLVHLQFVKPRFDPEAFKVMQSSITNYLIRRSKDVGEKIKDSLTLALYGKENPRESIFDQKYADAVSFEKISSIYKQRFSDISDFEFFMVGDIDQAQLEPLLKKYIAGIETGNLKEKFADNAPQWLSERIEQDIQIQMKNPKAVVKLVYKKEMPYSIKNALYSNVLGDILQLRLIATVREAEGGAYSPNAGGALSREPKSQVLVSFNFDCNPKMADKLVGIVQAEFVKISKGDIADEDWDKIKTNLIKEHLQARDKNSYDMRLLTQYFRYGENISDPKNFEEIVSKMTKKEIQQLAESIIGSGKSYKIVFKPKS